MKSVLHVFYLVILISFTSSLMAQDSGIKGIILDEETKDVLIGANIVVGDLATITSIDGNFSLNLEPGDYILQISYVGYETFEMPVTVEPGHFTEVNQVLSFSANILQTATVTGSKNEKSLALSPVSINVVKPQLLENTNTVNITSLLDKIPGVQIIDNQANIRGGSGWSYGAGSRVLLLIDDIPALQADAGRPSWGDIPVENISQIEVLKGASSTLYGSAALNGIINIRTGYATAEPITKANVSYTSYMSPKDLNKKWWSDAPRKTNIGIVHKQKFGKLDVVANGFYEDFDSYLQDGFDEKMRLSANLKYRLNDRVNFGLNTMLNLAESGNFFLWRNGSNAIYTAYEGTFLESDSRRYYLDPQLTIYDRKGNRHKILGRFYYINNDNNNNQSNSSSSWYSEYQFSRNFEKQNLNLTSGLVGYFTTSNSEIFQDIALRHNNASAYVEVDKEIIENLTVTAGLRMEYNVQLSPEVFLGDTIPDGKVDESKLISRFGVNYAIGEGTFLRGSWGQGYRFPTLLERFIETGVGGFYVFPNVNLQSESGWSAELGIKQGLKIKTWEGFLDLAVFWSRYKNMTEFSVQIDDMMRAGFQSKNVGDTEIKGFEVNWVGRSVFLGIPVNILAGYTYLDPRYQDFENNEPVLSSISIPIGETEKQNILKYRNRHNFKIDIEAFLDNFSAGFSYNYTSTTETIDQLLGSLGQIRLYRIANPGGFNKMDGRLAYDFGFIKCSVLMENILNEEITYRPGLLEAPRSIGLRLDFEI
ncbi:MAG: TonB-dependent receptor [Saprospiraceae bacterium]